MYCLSVIVMVYTEHYAWFWLLASTACFSYLSFKKRLPVLVLRSQVFCFLSCIPLVLLIAYQALFRENMFQADRMKEYMVWVVLIKKIIGVYWHLTCGYYFSMLTTQRIGFYAKTSLFFWLSCFSTVISLAALLSGFKGMLKLDKPLFIFSLFCFVFPPLVLLWLYPIRLDARYLSFLAPTYFLLIGYGISLWKRPMMAAGIMLIVFVSFFGSAHAVVMRTDSIHKEDYRGLISKVLSAAEPGDVICGLMPQVTYYGQGYSDRNVFLVEGVSKLGPDPRKTRFKRIWVLDIVNMRPDVTDRMCRERTAEMRKMGYVPIEPMKRFDGPESLLAYGLFTSAT